ncbi:MAG: flippase [Patescibacteria group bacterium]|nr:flippase [Patescibacteria group bacterium]MBU1870893.1 flippase [Patescibacteria group bacterium]
MRLVTKIAYNVIVQIIGKIIATILGLIAIAVMTRYLGQAGFGQYTTIITFLSFFGMIADLGLTLVTAQMISDPTVNQNKILSNLFSLRLISAIIFLGLGPLTILFFPYDSIIKLGVIITALSFFFTALNQILVGLFQKHLKMIIVSIAEVISRIVFLIGIILVVYFNYGLIGIMVVTVASSAVSFIVHYSASYRYAKIKIQINLDIWLLILKKSWPLALTIIFNLIYLRADVLILSFLKSQAEVGIYGAAYRVVDILTAIPFLFLGVVLPIMTTSWINKNINDFKNIIQKSFDVLVIMAMPMLVGAQLLAKPIMVVVAGADFALSGQVFKILIIATFMLFISCLFAHGIIAINQQKKIISAYAFAAITAIIGYIIFIPKYSYFGAAWVTVYSELIIMLASCYLLVKYSQFKLNLSILLKALTASLIMAAIIYLILNKLNLLLLLIIAVMVYFVALYILKGFNKQDIRDLFGDRPLLNR